MISTPDEVNNILKDIKLFAFDMDGVIRIGQHHIDGSESIFQTIEKIGKKSIIITNECRYTPEEIIEDLGDMGIIISESIEILTSGRITYNYIFKKANRFPSENISIGIVGERGLYEALHPLTKLSNVEITDIPPKYKTKNLLIIGALNKIKISNLEKVLKWVKSGAKIILTCNDVSDPSSKGDFNLGMPRHILHMVKFNINTSQSYSCGKPNPLVAQKILELNPDINPEEILLIGDTLYTDIRLAEENNFKSLLVLSGNTKKEGIKSNVTEADIILPSIKDLNQIILKNISC